MKLDNSGCKLITDFEGLRLKAYKCPANIWTIGYGSTFYPDNTKVKEGDVITKEKAFDMFKIISSDFEKALSMCIRKSITQNQFNAVASLAYNIGIGAFIKSTLLKKININPNDETIKDEFLKWNKASGKVLSGLTKRRKNESNIYFS